VSIFNFFNNNPTPTIQFNFYSLLDNHNPDAVRLFKSKKKDSIFNDPDMMYKLLDNPNFMIYDNIASSKYFKLTYTACNTINIDEFIDFMNKNIEIISWDYFLKKSTPEVWCILELLINKIGVSEFLKKLYKNKYYKYFITEFLSYLTYSNKPIETIQNEINDKNFGDKFLKKLYLIKDDNDFTFHFYRVNFDYQKMSENITELKDELNTYVMNPERISRFSYYFKMSEQDYLNTLL